MSRKEGKLVMCDRCGDIVFLEGYIDPKTPGYNMEYKPIPEDWGLISGKDFCPHCYNKYQDMMVEFFGMLLEKGEEHEKQGEV